MGLAFLPENEVLTCILSLLRDPQTIFLQQNPKIADFLKYFIEHSIFQLGTRWTVSPF